MAQKLLIIFITVISTEIVLADTDKIVCYYGSWSTYRWGNGKFTVEDINPNLCTHLIYSFVGIHNDGTINVLDPHLEIDSGNIKRFNALKQKNSGLKTLVAIGGWNEGSERYSVVAADPVKRANLVKSAVTFVREWGFDGFDVDWEYPAQRGGASVDKKNYITLIIELRKELDKYGLLLTAAVAASPASVDLSYDVPNLSRYLDVINVMTYDFHASWDGVTGQNAPLFASSLDVAHGQESLNVDAAIRGWIQRGADPRKIALGLGAYGRSYTLTNNNNNKLGAPVSYAGNPGKYTAEAGMLGYSEIVELQNEGGWTTVWDDQQKTPYIFKGNQWIGYDNPKSIAIKVEYAKSLNLGGVMIWSIETDDFKGISGTKYALLNAVEETLGRSNIEPTSSESSSRASTQSSTPIKSSSVKPSPQSSTSIKSSSAKPSTQSSTSIKSSSVKPSTQSSTPISSSTNPIHTGDICQKEGYVRDPVDCSKFYYCLEHNGSFVPLVLSCNNGLVFNPETVSCDYAHSVQC